MRNADQAVICIIGRPKDVEPWGVVRGSKFVDLVISVYLSAINHPIVTLKQERELVVEEDTDSNTT